MNVVAKTETGRALGDAFAVVRDRLPGKGKIADQRRQAKPGFDRSQSGCREARLPRAWNH